MKELYAVCSRAYRRTGRELVCWRLTCRLQQEKFHFDSEDIAGRKWVWTQTQRYHAGRPEKWPSRYGFMRVLCRVNKMHTQANIFAFGLRLFAWRNFDCKSHMPDLQEMTYEQYALTSAQGATAFTEDYLRKVWLWIICSGKIGATRPAEHASHAN